MARVTMTNCGHQACDRRPGGSGFCSAHWWQVRTWGHTKDIEVRGRPVSDRILEQARAEGDCLIWTGYLNRAGYGSITWRRRTWFVHRAIWTETIGPIPEGLTIDHLCRRPPCVNTAHMEVVTLSENSRRAGGPVVANARRRARTHCPRGHEFTPENTRLRTDGRGRICRQCVRAWSDSRRGRV